MSESTKPIRLAKGDTAPNFELESDEYKHYALADFKHKNIVLYFYPQAMSSYCTTEACDFRDNLNRIEAAGYTVIGVSGDDVRPLQEFREKEHLNFVLLSDPAHSSPPVTMRFLTLMSLPLALNVPPLMTRLTFPLMPEPELS